MHTLVTGGQHAVRHSVVPGLTSWRTFRIGGVPKKALLRRAEASLLDCRGARCLVNSPAFTTLEQVKEIDTIILTVADIAGYEHRPTSDELLNPDRLAEWSKRNAYRLNGHVVELLPAEAALHIRQQYDDQPVGEALWIAMEPIVGSDGCPRVFGVGRYRRGAEWLRTSVAGLHTLWGLNKRIVLQLRKVAH